MPYWQYKKFEQAEMGWSHNEQGSRISLAMPSVESQNNACHTTGITPMVEQSISISQSFKSSVLTANSKITGAAGIVQEIKTPDDEKQNANGKGVKRSASPFMKDEKKRTKSGDYEKSGKLFQESNDWE